MNSTGKVLRHEKLLLAIPAAVISLLPFLLRQNTSGPGMLVHYLAQPCLSPFLAASLTASALIFFADRGLSRRDATLAAGLTVPLAAIYWTAGIGSALWVGAAELSGGAVLGIAAILAAALLGRIRLLFRTAVLPACMALTGMFLKASIKLHPRTLDPLLYRFDQTLGGQASFWMGRQFAHSEWLRNTSFLAYALLPAAAALAFIYERHAAPKTPVFRSLTVVFLSMGAIGSCLYHLVPATGPAFAFHAYYPASAPAAPLLANSTLFLADGARNAMPSLHVSWALLLFWSSRNWPRSIRAGFAAFFALTVCATLGLGEHYVVDLVVAFPFTLTVRAAFLRSVRCAAGAASVTGLWMYAVSSGLLIEHPHPMLNRALVALNVIGICRVQQRLADRMLPAHVPVLAPSPAACVSFHDGAQPKVFRSLPEILTEAA